MTDRNRWIGLAVFVIVCLGAGGLGAVATTAEIEGWNETIAKPSWTPPDWIFGPVWTTLYLLMANA
jgi:tryptophan-rich sensory protein